MTRPAIDGAIPLVLGVVGHRNIDPANAEVLTAALEREIRAFRKEYPNSPIIVLTSLAQGADLLAAKAARNAGELVRAPLPMPLEFYRQSTSFNGDEAGRAALNEFDAFVANGDLVETIVCPLPADGPMPGDWSSVAQSPEPEKRSYRRFAYANAGAYLVSHCHVLIGLWDGAGLDPVSPSGTAEHFLHKLTGRRFQSLPVTEHDALGFRGERGPVIVLHAPRVGGSYPERKAPGQRDVYLPLTKVGSEDEKKKSPPYCSLGDVPLAKARSLDQRLGTRIHTALGFGRHKDSHHEVDSARAEVTQFQDICQTVEDFNVDAAKLRARQDEWSQVIQKGAEAAVPFVEPAMKRWARQITLVYEVADRLSISLEPRVRRGVIMVFLVVAAVITLSHLYAHPIDPPWGEHKEEHGSHAAFLAASLAGWVLIFLAILWFWRKRIEERRLDVRALAEALRVRLWWGRAGIDRSVSAAYPGQLRSEVGWVRQTLYHICPPPRFWKDDFDKQHPNQLECLGAVLEKWVIDQRDYYERTHRRQHRLMLPFRLGGLLLALAGFAWQFGLLIANLLDPAEHYHPGHIHLVGSGLMVVFGGLLIAYGERRAFENLAQHYERMMFLFDNAYDEIKTILKANLKDEEKITAIKLVCSALGKEAVAEQANWLVLRRARPMEVQLG